MKKCYENQESQRNFIQKSLDSDFEKARSGVYADTPYNRRKGLVGQHFGSSKKEETPQKKESSIQVIDKEQELNKIKNLKQERDNVIRHIDELRKKQWTKSPSGKPVKFKWVTDLINKEHRRIDTIDRKIDGIKHGESLIRNTFKSLEIPAVKWSSTAIKGYNVPSRGFEINSHDKAGIDLIGYSEEMQNRVIEDLQKKGFTVYDIKKPSKVIGGGGNVSRFKVKPII